MFKNVTLGQYLPGSTVIHALDPRTKLLGTLAFIILVFFVSSVWGYIATLAFIVAVAALARIKFTFLLRAIKPLLFIILFTVAINALFTTGATIYWKWWIFTLSREGILTAVYMALRLTFLILGSQLMTLTTSPLKLADATESLLKPLSALHFPVHELAMMMTIALRFIPTLMEETDRLMKAQSSRGADFESGNIIVRAKSMIPLLVPLFVSAFRRADELAMAMEARCYHGGQGRTKLKKLHFTKADIIGALFVLLYAGLIIADKVYFG